MVRSPTTPNTTISRPPAADAVREVLNLSFPRCSCCKTEWYDDVTEYSEKREACKPIASKRKRERPSHYTLLPMPNCSCITRLALPRLPYDVFSKEDCEDPRNVLSQIQTHGFPHLAICKSCLKYRIDASNEITEHDYRQEHIHNGQRNVKFTVELNCVQCKRKFRGRELEKLLESKGGPNTSNDAGGGRKNNRKADANWWEALEATIRLVGWAKREHNRERKRMRRQRRVEKLDKNGKAGDTEQTTGWWEKSDGFTGGDDNCSSDECYSLSSDSSDECEFTADASRLKKGPHRVALKSGELAKRLMQKDPKFRQEKEDEQYVQHYVQQLQEEEEKQKAVNARADDEYVKKLVQEEEEGERVEAEARAQNDHEIAMRLQEELNKSSDKFSPRRTRSKKNPIAEAWDKEASAKKQGRTRPPADKLGPETKQPKRAGTDLSDDKSSQSNGAKHSPGEAFVASSKYELRESRSITEPSIELLDDSSDDDTSDFDKSTKLPCETTDPESINYKQPKQKARASAVEPKIDDAPDDSSDDDDDGVIDRIVSMGFGRDSARRCLKDANGNIETALSILLSEVE